MQTKVTQKVREQYVPDEYYNVDRGIPVGNFDIVTRTKWVKFLWIWWPVVDYTIRFAVDGPFGWPLLALGYTMNYSSDKWPRALRTITEKERQ
jgi:hypothetical protein